MPFKIAMPQLGVTTTEGTIVCWHKKLGDGVKKGELLFEVTTDKVNTSVESTAEGIILAILYKEGETVAVTKIVAVVGEKGEDVDAFLNEVRREEAHIQAMAQGGLETKYVASSSPSPSVTGHVPVPSRAKISPLAGRIAQDNGLSEQELQAIEGTGTGGSITKNDVLAFIEKKKQAPSQVSSAQPSAMSSLSNMRKVVATKMLQSWREYPQFNLRIDVDATYILKKQNKLNKNAPANQDRIPLSINDFLIKATALAIRENPSINAIFSWEGIIPRDEVNVGIAVALENGLVVPVLKQVDQKSMWEIAKLRKEAVDRARSGKLTSDDLTGGSITISNLGSFGIDSFTAIINPPEGGILAVGRIREKLVMDDSGKIEKVLYLTIVGSFDHRLLDGAQCARFMQSLKENLE